MLEGTLMIKITRPLKSYFAVGDIQADNFILH